MKRGKQMEQKNPYQVYQEETPEVAAAFDNLIKSLALPDGLEPKTMQLIYIGIRASQGNADAVSAHVPMAKQFGATREEIKNTILLTLTVCGVSGVVSCLAPALNAYDAC